MTTPTLPSVRAMVLGRIRRHGWTFARDAAIVVVAYSFAEAVRFDGPIPNEELSKLALVLPLLVLVHGAFDYLFAIHHRLWKYAGIRDVRAIVDATFASFVLLTVADLAVPGERPLPVSVMPMGATLVFLGLTAVRLWRPVVQTRPKAKSDWESVLIVGAGQAGQIVVADLLANPQLRRYAVGFVDDDPRKQKMRIHGAPVLGSIDSLPEIVEERRVDIIGVAIPSASAQELDRIVALAHETEARIQILPSHAEVMSGDAVMRLRDLNLDDLLDRPPGSAVIEDPVIQASLRGKVVLVTGARGSIGFELVRQALRFNPARVLALDNNETGLFYLQREIAVEPNAALVTPVLADITDTDKLTRIFRRFGPEVVFHAAAYKHVPMLEAFPEEAFYVNVEGAMNLCQVARDFGAERFVFISTDKAVEPVNALGFSKRIGELVVRAHQEPAGTVFCSVRFGNVVGSRGSALPEFVRQIDAGGPVTVTHPDVERYFMTIPEAVGLVIQAGAFAEGGELFMLDMGKPIKIGELVNRIIRLRGLRIGKDIEVVYSGLRPGEKLSEELVFSAEATGPTPNPKIFAIQDGFHPRLEDLEVGIRSLARTASTEEPSVLRELMAEVASGQYMAVGQGSGWLNSAG